MHLRLALLEGPGPVHDGGARADRARRHGRATEAPATSRSTPDERPLGDPPSDPAPTTSPSRAYAPHSSREARRDRLPEVPRALAAVSEHPVPAGRGAAADAAPRRRPQIRRVGAGAGQRDAVVDLGVDPEHQLRHVLRPGRMLVRSGRPSEPGAVLHPPGHASPLQSRHVRRGRAAGGRRVQHPRVVAPPRLQLRRRGLLHRLVGAGRDAHRPLQAESRERHALRARVVRAQSSRPERRPRPQRGLRVQARPAASPGRAGRRPTST